MAQTVAERTTWVKRHQRKLPTIQRSPTHIGDVPELAQGGLVAGPQSRAIGVPLVVPPPVEVPHLAGGGSVPGEAGRVYQRSKAFALASGSNGAEAELFAQSMVALAYSENSAFDPRIVNEAGAVGLFQNIPVTGRGGRYTTEQLKDPDLNIDISLQELYPIFRQQGGGPAYARDPLGVVTQLSRLGQRPGEAAVQGAVRDGRFAQGIQLGQTVSGAPPPAGASGGAGAPVSRAAPPSNLPRGDNGWVLPVAGSVTSLFGDPFYLDSGKTFQGRWYDHFNSGIDVGAAPGSPVFALAGGRVKMAGDDGAGWGRRVVVVDGEGFEHSYGHLGDYSVKAGDTVAPGAQLGRVGAGTEGTSSGPHTSYDIFKNGEPVDPTPWLTQGQPGGPSAVSKVVAFDPSTAQRPAHLEDVAMVGESGGGGAGTRTQNQPVPLGQLPEEQDAQAAKADYQTALTAQRAAAAALAKIDPNDPGAEAQRGQAYAAQTLARQDADSAWDRYIKAAGLANSARRAYTADLATSGKADQTYQGQRITAQSANQTAAGKANDQLTTMYNLDSQLAQLQQEAIRDNNTQALNRFTAAREAVKDYNLALAQGFKDHNDALTLLGTTLNQRGSDMLAMVTTAQKNAELDLTATATIITAWAQGQKAQADYSVATLDAAKVVDAINWRNMTQILPPSQKYTPGTEPWSPMNQVLGRYGLNPVVYEATPVDVSKVSPEAAFSGARGQLQAQGWQPPGVGAGQILSQAEQAAGRARSVAPYGGQAADFTALFHQVEGLGDQVPSYLLPQTTPPTPAPIVTPPVARPTLSPVAPVELPTAPGEGQPQATPPPTTTTTPGTTAQAPPTTTSGQPETGALPGMPPGSHIEGDDLVLADGVTRIPGWAKQHAG